MFHTQKEGDCLIGLPLQRVEDRRFTHRKRETVRWGFLSNELKTGDSHTERGRLFDKASF